MIPEGVHIKCPWCEEHSTAKEWDDITFSECISREMKRAYKHITQEAVWGTSSNHFYKCPCCGTWSRGNQLKIVDTDELRLLKLGGKPILSIKREQE